MIIVSIPGYEVINFEINLIFLIKPFFYMTKKSRQKIKYLEKEKTFKVKQKAFFIIFKGSSLKQCSWKGVIETWSIDKVSYQEKSIEKPMQKMNPRN